jgi:hypothetical protein
VDALGNPLVVADYITCAAGSQPGSRASYEREEGQADSTFWQDAKDAPRQIGCDSKTSWQSFSSHVALATFQADADAQVTIYLDTTLPDEIGSFVRVHPARGTPDSEAHPILTEALSTSYHGVNVQLTARAGALYDLFGGIPKDTPKPWSDLTPFRDECSPAVTYNYTVVCTPENSQ